MRRRKGRDKEVVSSGSVPVSLEKRFLISQSVQWAHQQRGPSGGGLRGSGRCGESRAIGLDRRGGKGVFNARENPATLATGDEEKVAHNSPLLRRVLDPFSNRRVVGNFQEGRFAAIRDRFHPQIWRKRPKLKKAKKAKKKLGKVAEAFNLSILKSD